MGPRPREALDFGRAKERRGSSVELGGESGGEGGSSRVLRRFGEVRIAFAEEGESSGGERGSKAGVSGLRIDRREEEEEEEEGIEKEEDEEEGDEVDSTGNQARPGGEGRAGESWFGGDCERLLLREDLLSLPPFVE